MIYYINRVTKEYFKSSVLRHHISNDWGVIHLNDSYNSRVIHPFGYKEIDPPELSKDEIYLYIRYYSLTFIIPNPSYESVDRKIEITKYYSQITGKNLRDSKEDVERDYIEFY